MNSEGVDLVDKINDVRHNLNFILTLLGGWRVNLKKK